MYSDSEDSYLCAQQNGYDMTDLYYDRDDLEDDFRDDFNELEFSTMYFSTHYGLVLPNVSKFRDQKIIEEFEIDNKLNLTKDKISYNTLATSIDNLISLNLIDFPKLIKIDVDGNEIEILNGCSKLLNKGQSLSILIETRPSTEKLVEQKLTSHGFKKIKSLKYNSVWEN